MKYNNIFKGVFLSRPNRFIARVLLNDKEETVHVKNTGRCKELLREGCTVYLEKSLNPNRKTQFDLVAVEKIREGKENLLVNMDSQIPNSVAEEWLKKGNLFPKGAVIKREVTYKSSRFDLYAEYGDTRAFVEVKGVTLENDGKALFPDAPTQRGVKNINELINAKENGYDAYILFVVQMKEVESFSPNRAMHPEFSEALKLASEKGVNILAVDCRVEADSVVADKPVRVIL